MLHAALEMVETGPLSDLTMAAVATAAGVSRQTAYVQFGTRAGLLTEMVRERDRINPRGERLEAAIAQPDPLDSLVGATRELAAWWRDIHPIAQALFAASAADEAARAAWDDRMRHLDAITESLVERLAEADLLACGWDRGSAAGWLAAQLNPIAWVILVEGAGWAQGEFERRLVETVTRMLVAPVGAD